MRRRSSLFVALARVLAPCALLVGVGMAEATPAVIGAAGVYVGAPGHGARWVGGPYRPGWGAWGGWGYGYPRYRWGYGYGYGYGWGLGYGAGWALATAPYWGWGWGWGWPAAAYAAPSWVVPNAPATVVEQVVVEEQRAPAAPQAAPQQPGYWYYCTEPAGYHPYVSTCSRPWIAVNPTNR